jgi:Ca-activated chloride channel family protein
MQPANKLPLLKTAMKMLVGRLGENERVAIVTYSHEIRLVLPSTTCDSKETIIQALEGLQAAGSTNGGGGIQMAYSVAVENFIQGGVNRVLLATDGDFNVGITDPGELTRFIEQKRESGVFLSVLGFGMGNLKDATLERLADKGNGHFAYIDSIDEARKVLVDQLSGTLVTIAKDVKLQIEFNPRTVSAFRLIGYENRVMPTQDFNDDRKDAGDIGAGHTVTALYEIVPAGKSAGLPGTDPLKYQPGPEVVPDNVRRKQVGGLKDANDLSGPERLTDADKPIVDDVRRELLTVKLRYKKPNESQSLLAEVPLTDTGRRYGEASSDFKFASAVAAFGMILRGSPHRGSATLDGVLELGEDGRGADREGYRGEFLKLVRQAKSLRGQ